jgi:adenylyltransferase/sulfurtransferase
MELPSISPSELNVSITGGETLLLLDVREPEELAVSQLADVVPIPLGELGERFSVLDRTADIVVICRSGIRSANATVFLLGQGFERVRNLSGGMKGWAREVDPSLPVG